MVSGCYIGQRSSRVSQGIVGEQNVASGAEIRLVIDYL